MPSTPDGCGALAMLHDKSGWVLSFKRAPVVSDMTGSGRRGSAAARSNLSRSRRLVEVAGEGPSIQITHSPQTQFTKPATPDSP